MRKESIIVLNRLARAVRYSLHAHVPRQALRFNRGDGNAPIGKHLHLLAKEGLVVAHPTHGETTWQLTRCGLKLALKKAQAASS